MGTLPIVNGLSRKQRWTGFLSLCTIAAAGFVFAIQSGVAVESRVTPIDVPIDQLGRTYQLTGRLGKPLGQIVKVQGVVIEGRQKGYEGGPNLLAQRIDGVATQDYRPIPLTPWFGEWGSGKLPPDVKMGGTFELEGYESGGFVGTPDGVMEKAGVIIQTTGHYFKSSFAVFAGVAINPVKTPPSYDVPRGDVSKINALVDTPSDYVGRVALLSGTARNTDGQAVIEGKGWQLVVDGSEWDPFVVGKLVEARGTVRELEKTRFRLECGPKGQRGLVKLGDQLGRDVALRCTAWSMNNDWWLDYRGETLYFEDFTKLGDIGGPHGDAVLVHGVLEHATAADMAKIPHHAHEERPAKDLFVVRHANWERTSPLLIQEHVPVPR